MSEIAIIGYGAICLAFLAITLTGVSATIAALTDRPRYRIAAEYGAYLICTLFGVASTAMIHAFIHHDYSLMYVYEYSDASMPWYYQLAAFWGGQAGSLMFWALLLSLFLALVTLFHRKRDAALMPWLIATMCTVLFFFTGLLLFVSNPFESYSIIDPPGDGRGLNPQLQVFTMIIHPPSLLAGYVSATVPFAFAMAALLSGRIDDDAWLKATRKWTLVSWGLLTIGLILGMLWAYTELGWGGYWAWDPVENAAFIPWLVLTAFLHSAVIQEKRGMLKRWNMFLVLLAWLLTIFGTFLTRSGLIASVHSFAQSDIGDYFLYYMLVMLAVIGAVFAWRWKRLAAEADIETPLSREFAFLFNNWVLLIGAAFVMFGTLFPKLKEMVTGTEATLGEPWFNTWMTPVGVIMLALTGVGVVISWRRASAHNFKRNFVWPLVFAAGVVVVLPALYWYFRLRFLIGGDGGLDMGLSDLLGAIVGLCIFSIALVTLVLGLAALGRDRESSSGALAAVLSLVGLGGFVALWFYLYEMTTWQQSFFSSDVATDIFYSLVVLFFCAFVTGTIWTEFWRGTRVRMNKLKVGPFTAFTGLLLRNQRRYGGYIVHLGIMFLMFGFIGYAFTVHEEVVMRPGEVTPVGDYTVKLTETWEENDPEKVKFFARVEVYDRDGDLVDVVQPGRFYYHASDAATSEIDIRSRLSEDLYFAVINYDLEQPQPVVALLLGVNPFVIWVWIGGIVMVFGTGIAMWPVDPLQESKRRRRRRGGGSGGGGGGDSGRKGKRAPVSKSTLVGIIAILAWPAMLLLSEGVARADEAHGPETASMASQTREIYDPAVKEVFSHINCECVNCAGQTIGQCKPTCGEGKRDRSRVLELYNEGYTQEQIIQVFRDERGEAGVAASTRDGFNNIGWILPIVGLGLAVPLIAFGFARMRRSERADEIDEDALPLHDPAIEDELDDELDLEDPVLSVYREDELSDDDEERLEALERELDALE